MGTIWRMNDIVLLIEEWDCLAGQLKKLNALPVEGQTYKEKLENAVAGWLAEGIIAYQKNSSRRRAFGPVSRCIKTPEDEIYYTESLIGIADYFREGFRPSSITTFSSGTIFLEACYATGIGKAAGIVASQFGKRKIGRETGFGALKDSLSLIRAIEPNNAKKILPAIWSMLNNEAKHRLNWVKRKHPGEIEQAFALACYPVCCSADGCMVKDLVDDLWKTAGKSSFEILKADLKACKEALRRASSFCVPA